MRKFEWVEHPADLGVRLYGTSLAGLFENSVEALFAALDVTAGPPGEKLTLSVSAESPEELLVRFLEELLYRLEAKQVASRTGRVRIQAGPDGYRLTSELAGRKVTRVGREIKAVTYHNLKIEKKAGRYQCTVIFDL